MIALIIDDDKDAASTLARLLHATWKIEIEPLEVLAFGTLAEGLAVADRANVTILDLRLPDSGIDNTIASIKRFRPPVIVLSGYASNDEMGHEFVVRCMAAGADHVFCKGHASGLIPSVFEALQKDIVRRATERHQRETSDGTT